MLLDNPALKGPFGTAIFQSEISSFLGASLIVTVAIKYQFVHPPFCIHERRRMIEEVYAMPVDTATRVGTTVTVPRSPTVQASTSQPPSVAGDRYESGAIMQEGGMRRVGGIAAMGAGALLFARSAWAVGSAAVDYHSYGYWPDFYSRMAATMTIGTVGACAGAAAFIGGLSMLPDLGTADQRAHAASKAALYTVSTLVGVAGVLAFNVASVPCLAAAGLGIAVAANMTPVELPAWK